MGPVTEKSCVGKQIRARCDEYAPLAGVDIANVYAMAVGKELGSWKKQVSDGDGGGKGPDNHGGTERGEHGNAP